jgi:hypothetical protein
VSDKFNCIADTFHIKTFSGINELSENNVSFSVYPNPGSDNFTLSVRLKNSSDVSVSISTVSGKNFIASKNKTYAAGTHKLNICSEGNSLAEGVYFVQLQVNGNVFTKKLVMLK